jgi:hypothetical protein
MIVQTHQQALETLRQSGFVFDDKIEWASQDIFSAQFTLPKIASKQTALARALVRRFTSGSAILLIEEFDIWESAQNLFLYSKISQIAIQSQEVVVIHDFPAYLSTPSKGNDDADYLEALFAISLYFCWGVLLCSLSPRIMMRTTNDEVMYVCAEDSIIIQEIQEITGNFGLQEISLGVTPGSITNRL